MKLVELILDDEDAIGVEAISVVLNPAIESDFIALSKHNIELAEINKEKRLLMGALFLRLRKCTCKTVINQTQR